jgi:hypothetical protein
MTESVTLPQYTLGSGGIEQERLYFTTWGRKPG